MWFTTRVWFQLHSYDESEIACAFTMFSYSLFLIFTNRLAIWTLTVIRSLMANLLIFSHVACGICFSSAWLVSPRTEIISSTEYNTNAIFSPRQWRLIFQQIYRYSIYLLWSGPNLVFWSLFFLHVCLYLCKRQLCPFFARIYPSV